MTGQKIVTHLNLANFLFQTFLLREAFNLIIVDFALIKQNYIDISLANALNAKMLNWFSLSVAVTLAWLFPPNTPLILLPVSMAGFGLES